MTMTDEELCVAIGLPPEADLLEWARNHLREAADYLEEAGDIMQSIDAAALHIVLEALEDIP